MRLRPYRISDLAQIVALDRECFPPRFCFSRSAMHRFTQGKHAIVDLIVDEDPDGKESLLGFSIVHLLPTAEESAGYLVTLDVARSYRRLGLGEQLLRTAESKVLAAGAPSMQLHVYVENLSAMRLYERLGYERVRRICGFYDVQFDAFLYRKNLVESHAGDEQSATTLSAALQRVAV